MCFTLDCSSASATACALTNPRLAHTKIPNQLDGYSIIRCKAGWEVDMDPSIKFDDYSAEEQALMKSAPYVMKPLQDWHYKDVLHFFKTNVTNEKSCIKAYIYKILTF
jgi:hypothetical protein